MTTTNKFARGFTTPRTPPTYECCLCKQTSQGYGNNPYPLDGDLCCDKCNCDYIVLARIALQHKEQQQGRPMTNGEMTRFKHKASMAVAECLSLP